MKYDSHFTFKRLQFKSINKLRLFAELFGKMEEEFGIRTCKITLEDCFICSDISEEEIESLNRTPNERYIQEIVKKLK